jgi:hypothetical protein
MSDDEILAIRDERLPSQGEAFNTLAFGRAVAAQIAGNVRPLAVGDVSRRTDVAVRAMDAAIVAAINAAKNAGVPQGLIVGLLHSYAHDQTASMLASA